VGEFPPHAAGYVVGSTDEIPDGARMIVAVCGRSIGVFNVGGTFYALLNRCPHQGAQLCLGVVSPLIESARPGDVRFDESRHMLQCPWHHWEFDLATGQSYCDPRRTRVRPYPVSVQTGEVVADAIDEGRLVPGPYTAQTIPVTVRDGYVVLSLRRPR
jgi:3-phenylpropionate/trans-cinnamate dioxygenase ferredoxin subunit